ncbi:MAG: peptidylprolyl isomerase [Pseudomonadota bacterium]|nr:peptidylprolyl isomerase [Pseudomonadota bacterium]
MTRFSSITALSVLLSFSSMNNHAQGIAQAAPLPAAVVATVNGVAISQSALDNAVKQARARGLSDTPELRATVRGQLIAKELLRQEAEKKNLAADPEVQSAANAAREAAMLQKYLRDAVKPRPVNDADVKAYYEKIIAALGPLEYKTRIIQTPDQASAKLALAEIKAGKSFADTAKQFSKAQSAANGGALDWVSFKLPLVEGQTQGYPLPLAEKLLLLTSGMVTAQPVQWKNAWYVVKVDEARPTQIPDFEKVKTALKQTLVQKEIERASTELVASLVKNAKISDR